MAWVIKNNVNFRNLYAKMPFDFGGFKMEFSIPKENSCFPDYYEIDIFERNLGIEFKKLYDKKVGRIYFTCGMQDIDMFYNNDGKFCIDHSPIECEHVLLIFKDGEDENILKCFHNNYSEEMNVI